MNQTEQQTMPAVDPLQLLDVDQVAELMHISRDSVVRMIDGGELPHIDLNRGRKKNRLIRVRRIDAEAFIRSGMQVGRRSVDGKDNRPQKGTSKNPKRPANAARNRLPIEKPQADPEPTLDPQSDELATTMAKRPHRKRKQLSFGG